MSKSLFSIRFWFGQSQTQRVSSHLPHRMNKNKKQKKNVEKKEMRY